MKTFKSSEDDSSNLNSDNEERWSKLMSYAQIGDNSAYHKLLTELTAVTGAVLINRLGFHCPFLDDCTQEIMLAIHKARHTYDSQQPFKPWFFAIVRNKSVDFIRKHSYQNKFVVYDPEDHQINRIDSNETLMDEALYSEQVLKSLLKKLPTTQREAIIKTKLEGKSLKEAAKELKVTEGALKVRTHRAISKMKRLFQREDHEKN